MSIIGIINQKLNEAHTPKKGSSTSTIHTMRLVYLNGFFSKLKKFGFAGMATWVVICVEEITDFSMNKLQENVFTNPLTVRRIVIGNVMSYKLFSIPLYLYT